MIGPFPIRVALGHVGPPLLLFLLLFVGHPFRDVFSFNPDESNNLMKAQLVAAGHSLFSDIWSDQPAVFTYMLRHWMDFTAWTVEQARILVLLCSCVLIWSFYQVVRRTASHVGAALACLLLVTSHQYLYLSASVMLAIPSLMFAVLSLHAALMQQQRSGLLWPTVSGACLALANLCEDVDGHDHSGHRARPLHWLSPSDRLGSRDRHRSPDGHVGDQPPADLCGVVLRHGAARRRSIARAATPRRASVTPHG